MWFQYKNDLDQPIPYTPIDCLLVPFIAASDEYVKHQIKGMHCPNMGAETPISLRNSISGTIDDGDFFYFVVDSCMSMREYTGKDESECVDDTSEEFLDKLKNISVFVKIS